MRYLTERAVPGTGGLLDFPRSVDDLFQRFWGAPAAALPTPWLPHVEVSETPQAYVVRAELPGIDPEAVDVTVTRETLTIRGEKKLAEPSEGEARRLCERVAGRFERTFTFPTPVATDGVEAEARHGVLTVTVAKAAEAQPRKIAIRAS